MAETTADVRRDIELTRERMSDTLAELERKVNVVQVVRDHPWPALALAAGAGFLLARSQLDVKAAAATVAATQGAGTKLGQALDDVAARLITGVSGAVQGRLDGWVSELKDAIGAPRGDRSSSMRTRDTAVPRSVAVEPDGEMTSSGLAPRAVDSAHSAPIGRRATT